MPYRCMHVIFYILKEQLPRMNFLKMVSDVLHAKYFMRKEANNRLFT